MSTSLYELGANYKTIEHFDIENEEDATAFIELLNDVESDMEVKALKIGHVILQLAAEAKLVKAEEARLAARRSAKENKVSRLKEYLLDGLKTAHLDRVESAELTVSLAKAPASLKFERTEDDVIKEDLLPAEFIKTIPASKSIDKRALLLAVKADPEVFAGVVKAESGKRLSIR